MRWTIVISMAALLAALAGCGPGADATTTLAPTDVEELQATLTSAPAEVSEGESVAAPQEEFREALTAREAWPLAEAAAQTAGADYALYEVLGCHKGAEYGSIERDAHLVEGACTAWTFYFVRPVDPESMEGYTALYVRVGPNGVLETTEEPHDKQVRKQAQGDVADWQIDSAQAIEIAEGQGGQAYREANPEWDTALFEADRNAAMVARLQFTPYWDSESGTDYGGSANAVWVITYPPLHALTYVIDAATGEVLLAQE